jgi:hypothetical protein
MKLFLCLSALVALSVADSSTMPLFTWQGASGSAPVSEPKSVDSALASAVKTGNPELVMLYMMQETSAQQMLQAKDDLPNLRDAVSRSQFSSFKALPLAKAQISDMEATARNNGCNMVKVDHDKLEDFFKSNADLLSNSKPDVVLVQFKEGEKLASVDAAVGKIEEQLSGLTDKFNSILSTTSSMAEDSALNLMGFDASSGLWTRYPTVAQSYDIANDGSQYLKVGGVSTRRSILYGPSVYLTPTLLLAIMVFTYIAVLLLAALCCILSLQTPEKFEKDYEKEMEHALDPNASSH